MDKTRSYLPITFLILLLVGCVVEPKPGAKFISDLEIKVDQASSARFYFGISSLGNQIEYVMFEITELNCAAISAERSSYYTISNIPILSGKFHFTDPGIGEVSGRFVTQAEARGTIHIFFDWERGGALTNFIIHDRTASCDLGTLDWTATAP
jgi:hypothetical protein